MLELEFLHVQHFSQTNVVEELGVKFIDMVNIGMTPTEDVDSLLVNIPWTWWIVVNRDSTSIEGASTSVIDKLVKNNSFVASYN